MRLPLRHNYRISRFIVSSDIPILYIVRHQIIRTPTKHWSFEKWIQLDRGANIPVPWIEKRLGIHCLFLMQSTLRPTGNEIPRIHAFAHRYKPAQSRKDQQKCSCHGSSLHHSLNRVLISLLILYKRYTRISIARVPGPEAESLLFGEKFTLPP